ncbi:MAG: MBL fold metallo-hydrolase [Candidatus Coproplasma sp.]
MKPKIHQIKIDFNVTPEIKRYVYVYLIEGKSCWLVDSGVDGTEKIIADFMSTIGRSLGDIRGVLLTHAHPDHIGSVAKLKELTGCKVYASAGERAWIEDVELQFAQRPIPNFHTLVNKSVPVDEVLKGGDIVELQDGLTIEVVATPGHSADELSYKLVEERCIFVGDAIPVVGDIPIWINAQDSLNSLIKLKDLQGVDTFCPAWDVTYNRTQALQKIDSAIELINKIGQAVNACKAEANSIDDLVLRVCTTIGTPHFTQNPLFKRTVASFLK